MLTLLLVILVVAVLFGGLGQQRGWGTYGWSPAGIILLVLVVMFLTGRLH